MAKISISQHPLQKYGDKLMIVRPKPSEYQKRVEVTVSDEVVRAFETQPVLDAYAVACNEPEWVGKDMNWYKEEQHLQLGFHILSYEDGTPVAV